MQCAWSVRLCSFLRAAASIKPKGSGRTLGSSARARDSHTQSPQRPPLCLHWFGGARRRNGFREEGQVEGGDVTQEGANRRYPQGQTRGSELLLGVWVTAMSPLLGRVGVTVCGDQ